MKIFIVPFFCVFLPPLLNILIASVPFLSFIKPIFTWNVLLVSLIFLKGSLVFPILLFSSISLCWSLRKAFLSLLAIFETLHSDAYIFPFLLCFLRSLEGLRSSLYCLPYLTCMCILGEKSHCLYSIFRDLLSKMDLKLSVCFMEPRSDGLSYREYEIMFSRSWHEGHDSGTPLESGVWVQKYPCHRLSFLG